MNGRRRERWALIVSVAALTAGGAFTRPAVVYAQGGSAPQDQRVEDLKRQLAELEKTTAAQIAAIRQQIDALQPSAPAAAAAPASQTPPVVPTGAAAETF